MLHPLREVLKMSLPERRSDRVFPRKLFPIEIFMVNGEAAKRLVCISPSLDPVMLTVMFHPRASASVFLKLYENMGRLWDV